MNITLSPAEIADELVYSENKFELRALQIAWDEYNEGNYS